MMPNLWKPMYLYSTWNTYSLKDILDTVILSSRVSASRTWKFEERRDKISPYQKAHNYGIILAEKEKEGLASDTYFFFSSSTPHHLLLFWHSLLHSHMVDQTGILINLFLKRKKKQTEERKEKKKLASQKKKFVFWKKLDQFSNLFWLYNLVVLIKATGQQAMAQGDGGRSQQGREKMP